MHKTEAASLLASSTRSLITRPVALMGCGKGQIRLQWVQGKPANRGNKEILQAEKPQRRSHREKSLAAEALKDHRHSLARSCGASPDRRCGIKSVTERVVQAWCRLESSDVVRLRARSLNRHLGGVSSDLLQSRATPASSLGFARRPHDSTPLACRSMTSPGTLSTRGLSVVCPEPSVGRSATLSVDRRPPFGVMDPAEPSHPPNLTLSSPHVRSYLHGSRAALVLRCPRSLLSARAVPSYLVRNRSRWKPCVLPLLSS